MKTSERLKKNITWIVTGIVLVIAGLLYGLSLLFGVDADKVTVFVDGKVYGDYSLKGSYEIPIKTQQGYNLLIIEDGQAYVAESDCKNQVCVHTQPVSRTGGQIVCLPHRVIIRLKATEKSEIDAVTN